MKINCVYKDGLNIEELEKLINLYFPNNIISEKPDYVFSFGGDGTFLQAINKYGDTPNYIAINMGSLGFYATWELKDLELISNELLTMKVSELSMLEINYLYNNKVQKHFCLNEMTIINPIKTQILNVYINGQILENFRGTGICISTPSGSTAYNKSLGGSIISINKSLYQLTHIAPIDNIKYRNIGNSIILDENEEITLSNKEEGFISDILTVDQKYYSLEDVYEIKIKLSSKKIKQVISEKKNFYEQLKNIFIGE